MKSCIFAVLLSCLTTSLFAQFNVKVSLENDGVYSVFLKPSIDISSYVIGSAQLTIVVPYGVFEVADFQPKAGTWEYSLDKNSNTAGDKAYLRFSYIKDGLGGRVLKKEEAILLFTFKNNGPCPGNIDFIKKSDPQISDLGANVGLDFSVLDLATSNTYDEVGIYAEASANCERIDPTTDTTDVVITMPTDPDFQEPTVVKLSTSSASLKWADVPNARRYELRVRYKGHSDWVKSIKVAKASAFFYAPKNAAYEYQIIIHFEDGTKKVSGIYNLLTIAE